jgi:hypothetical protein
MRFKSEFEKKQSYLKHNYVFLMERKFSFQMQFFIIKLSAFIRALKRREKVFFFAEIKTFSNLTLGKKLILHRFSKNFYFGKVLQEG